jgi:hypothetical protein
MASVREPVCALIAMSMKEVQEKLLPGELGFFTLSYPLPPSEREGCDGAAERCRESEGVPRFFSSLIPQEWWTEGVEHGQPDPSVTTHQLGRSGR